MQNEIAIKVENLTKVYHLYDKPQDRLKEALNPFKKSYHHDFYAVNDISFEIKKGETVGIIGKNGAGKSTLLKMITGVLNPTSGNIQVNGKIASLLELGAGFNPEMTGIENIYLNGTLMGFSKQEMDTKIDAILEFADIGEFIYQPVKVYSSGMFARLAFSVAINVEPDILIIDEALSVGDMAFQQKCVRRMESFAKLRKTILFVTHDIGLINKFCSKAVWIERGEIDSYGVADEVTKKYFLSMSYGNVISNNIVTADGEESISIDSSNVDWVLIKGSSSSLGEITAQITAISIYSDTKKRVTFSAGDKISILIKIRVLKNIKQPIIGFVIKDRLGMDITGANTIIFKEFTTIKEFKTSQDKIIQFKFEMPYLMNGKYSISPAIADGEELDHESLCWVDDAVFFDIISSKNYRDIGWYFGLGKVVIEEFIV